jgi:hypothetical protein
VNPRQLKGLEAKPESLATIIEEMRERDVFFNPRLCDPLDRALYTDEFTLSLLTDLFPMEPPLQPLNEALVVADHILEGACYGYGAVLYHPTGEVQELAHALNRISEGDLRERAEQVREAGVSGPADWEDQPSLEKYQQAHFDRVRAFYREAAQHGDAILVLTL